MELYGSRKRSKVDKNGYTLDKESKIFTSALGSTETSDKNDILYFKSSQTNSSIVQVEVSWWKIRELITSGANTTELIFLVRKPCHTVLIGCELPFLKQVIKTPSWIKMKLSRMISQPLLSMLSENVLSVDKIHLSIFVKSFDILSQDIERQKQYFIHQNSFLKDYKYASSETLVDRRLRAEGFEAAQVKPKLVTYELQLTKKEVSYLIGKSGSRIESIRDTSSTVIKICPIPFRISSNLRCRQKKIEQIVIVTGGLYNVAFALTIIESVLNLQSYLTGDGRL